MHRIASDTLRVKLRRPAVHSGRPAVGSGRPDGFAISGLDRGEATDRGRGIVQSENGVALERGAVVGVPHDALGDLRRDTGAGEVRAEGGTECVEIRDAAFGVGAVDPRLVAETFALADPDGLPIGAEDGNAAGDSGPEEVGETGAVGHGFTEDTSRGQAGMGLRVFTEGVDQLRVHGEDVDPLGLPVADGERSFGEVDVTPFEFLEIAPAESGEGGTEIPRRAAPIGRDRHQAGEFIVGERAANPAAVLGFVLLRDGFERIAEQPAGLDAPPRERDHLLTGEVHGAGGAAGRFDMREVGFEGVGGEFVEEVDLGDFPKAPEVLALAGEVLIVQADPLAVFEVMGFMDFEPGPALNGEPVGLGVDDAFAA